MLKSKSILAPKEASDGIRISIMSRHTLNDGQTPDMRLDTTFDEHIPIFAAPQKLIGDYYKRNLSFIDFSKRYIDYLDTIVIDIIDFIYRSIETDVTVMCIESSPECCHRRLFVEYCLTLSNEMDVHLLTEIN